MTAFRTTLAAVEWICVWHFSYGSLIARPEPLTLLSCATVSRAVKQAKKRRKCQMLGMIPCVALTIANDGFKTIEAIK